ncbi:hypothetical protein AB3M96_11020 [Fredinandcohnia sp. 179-A 10B2 NHS]
MRSWVFISCGLFMIILSVVGTYLTFFKPQVGPIGNGTVSTLSKVLLIYPVLSGAFFLTIGIVTLIHKGNSK